MEEALWQFAQCGSHQLSSIHSYMSAMKEKYKSITEMGGRTRLREKRVFEACLRYWAREAVLESMPELLPNINIMHDQPLDDLLDLVSQIMFLSNYGSTVDFDI